MKSFLFNIQHVIAHGMLGVSGHNVLNLVAAEVENELVKNWLLK